MKPAIEYNVTGAADNVSRLIEYLKGGKRDRVVTDCFPCATDKRDVNVRVDPDLEEGFCDKCEELQLSVCFVGEIK